MYKSNQKRNESIASKTQAKVIPENPVGKRPNPEALCWGSENAEGIILSSSDCGQPTPPILLPMIYIYIAPLLGQLYSVSAAFFSRHLRILTLSTSLHLHLISGFTFTACVLAFLSLHARNYLPQIIYPQCLSGTPEKVSMTPPSHLSCL